MVGDLGLWGKQTMFHQSSHIPLTIRDPRRAPGEIAVPAQTTDLVPTIRSRLGAQAPGSMGGCDLDVAAAAASSSGSPACRAAVLPERRRHYVHFGAGFVPMLFDTA